jgi:hypothetical protein
MPAEWERPERREVPMFAYTCYHCGAPLNLARPPAKERHCPKCKRKLRVCNNCQFFDVSGCILEKEQFFTATHGMQCSSFKFRTVVT